MLRHWAYRLLALTLIFALLQGALIFVRAPVPFGPPGASAVSSALDDRLQPAIQTLPTVVESSRTAPQGRQQAASGNDPTLLLLVLAAAAALIFPLPARGAAPAWQPPAIQRANRPRGAGRCPTGPPVQA